VKIIIEINDEKEAEEFLAFVQTSAGYIRFFKNHVLETIQINAAKEVKDGLHSGQND
jgi:hypothetical protein